MSALSSVRRHAVAAARWLAPSAAAACVAALVTGIYEGTDTISVLGAVATTGFATVLVLPALIAVIALIRGLAAAWDLDELGLALVEDGGGAPRLAGWLGFLVLAAAGLGWAVFEGTWLLGLWTQFKPLPVAFAEGGLAIATVAILAVASRPVVRGLTAAARALDAGRRRRHPERRSLLLPRRIIGVVVAIGVIALYVVWRVLIKPRIGPVTLDVFRPPVAGLAAAVIVHLTWRQLPRAARLAAGALLAVATVIALIGAGVTWQTEPSLTLEIWGDRPVAGFAIDHLLDLDAIRADVSPEQFKPATRPGAAHPDIVLITIDTVRADHVPGYGGIAHMPALQALAGKGALFEWAISPSNVTRRSIPSMVIGLAPNRVHGRVVGWALRVDPRHVLLAERLHAAGYETAGFMCCKGFWGSEAHTGLARGLDYVDVEDELDELPDGHKLAARARKWLDARAARKDDKALFVWMHILEPHNWSTGQPEPRNEEDRRRLYDRSLAASDEMLADVLGAFAQRPTDKAPIVIVTADHGEALGEHGQPFHSTDLYDSQTHVPLVIAGPGIPAHRVTETVSLTDLVPTVLELAGFVPPHGRGIDGYSIADLATGRRTGLPDAGIAFSAMIKDRSNPGGISAVTKGPWKLIDNGGPLELYNIHTDPAERINLALDKPRIIEDLRKLLGDRVDAGDRSPFD